MEKGYTTSCPCKACKCPAQKGSLSYSDNDASRANFFTIEAGVAPRRSRLRKWLSYVLTGWLVLLVAAGSLMLFQGLKTPTGYRADAISISKTPKQEGFAIWGYHDAESCAGKNRTMIMKGSSADVTSCMKTDVNFQSIRVFNGIPGEAKFGVCLYPGSDCRADKPLTAQPLEKCGSFNSTEVGSFMMTWGVLGGECP